MTIRLVTFDALHTLVTPRLPIYVQYSQIFAPYFGVLEPGLLRQSFEVALTQVQKKNPAYQGDSGADGWWSEVIKRTAIGAGANPQAVDSSLPQIVPSLMERFSSRQGYKLFHDSLPVLRRLRQMNIRTALISNTDTRMLSVLKDLEIAPYLDSVILSEAVEIEKPDAKIFQLALVSSMKTELVPMEMQDGVHIGDELERYDLTFAKTHYYEFILVIIVALGLLECMPCCCAGPGQKATVNARKRVKTSKVYK